MTASARYTLLNSILSSVAAVTLAVAIAPAWAPAGIQPFVLVFLAGPPLFLALLAWRRREHPERSLFLNKLVILVTIPGLAILLYDYFRFRNEPPGEHAQHLHPLIIPLVQWVVVLVYWIVMAIREGREKRADQVVEKKA